MSFSFEDLKNMYLDHRKKYPNKPYKKLSVLFNTAKLKHKKHFKGKDHGQSWRAFKGKNLEKLVLFIIEDYINKKKLRLKIIDGNRLERLKSENLNREECIIKRKLLIDYGIFGCHLPDVDMIIYSPIKLKILAVISSKVTLRERIAQTGYWKIKMSLDSTMTHIKMLLITLDQDQTLKSKKPAKKGRAIVEEDLDCTYVLTEDHFEKSKKVKPFKEFFEDLENIVNHRKRLL